MKRVLSFVAIAAMLGFFACQKHNNNETPNKEEPNKEEPNSEEPNSKVEITIDGLFEDWASADQAKIKSFKNNPDSPWEAVKEIRVYANTDFVYYYIRFNHDSLEELLENNEALPIRLCINTDGEFTSGYESYFLEAYDFIIEGPLGDGEGKWGEYDGTLHQRVNEKWNELLKPGNNLVKGMGKGDEYEIFLVRDLFNNAVPAEHKLGDVFHTGIRFYGPAWDELSNMPNSSVDEGEGNGWGHLLEITTDK